MNTFGDRIRYIREMLGASQEMLGAAIGQNRLLIARWEGGRQEPRLPQLRALAEILNISPEWLIEGKGEFPEITQAMGEKLLEAREKSEPGVGRVPSIRNRPTKGEYRIPAAAPFVNPQIPAVEGFLLSISRRISGLMEKYPDWPTIPGIPADVMTAFAKQRAIPSLRMIAAFAEAFQVDEEELLYGRDPRTGKIMKPQEPTAFARSEEIGS